MNRIYSFIFVSCEPLSARKISLEHYRSHTGTVFEKHNVFLVNKDSHQRENHYIGTHLSALNMISFEFMCI